MTMMTARQTSTSVAGMARRADALPQRRPRAVLLRNMSDRLIGSQSVQHIDQVAEPPVVLPVKAEGDALQVQGRHVVLFLGHWLDGANALAGDDVRKILVQR